MFELDTLRLIKNTLKRFLSLTLIVMIGVGFMMGLMSTSIIMRNSVDRYADDMDLHDLQIYSSYGFCDEDIEALQKLDVVEGLLASRFVDTYIRNDDRELVARFEELYRHVDQFELVEGRLPQKADEAAMLVDDDGMSFNASIGDTVEVIDKSAALIHKKYTITGFVVTPAYMTKVMDTSTCDNQPLNTVLFVSNSNFKADYYSTVYLDLKGADEKMSFTQPYDDYVAEKSEEISYLASDQENYLKEKLLDEYEKKLEDSEKEFNEKKAEGEKELQEAKQQLDDAYLQILIAKSQLDTSKATLETSKREVEANERLLNENEQRLNDAVKQAEEKSGQPFDTLYAEVSAAYTTYITLESQKTSTSSYTQETIARMEKEKSDNLQKISELQAQIDSLDQSAEDYAQRLSELTAQITEYEVRNQVLDTSINALKDLTESENIDAILKQMDEAMNGSVKQTYTDLQLIVEGRRQLESGRTQLESAKAQIAAGEEAIRQGQNQIYKGERDYEKGLKDYNEGLLEFNDQIEKAENELAKARQELEELPNANWILLNRDSHYSSYMYRATIKQMGAIGYALPLIFFLVAALVCLTTMTRLIDEQRSQIGIFRALGFSNNRIAWKYVSYALFATLLGSVIGIFLGQALFPTVIYKTWRLMYALPDIRMSFPIVPLLVSILSFSALMMGVTYIVIRRSLKEMPSQLMRPKAPKSVKEIFLEKITFIWKRLSFTSKITARNLIRYKSRFFMTVIGVAGCTALLVVGFGIKDSISQIVNIQYGQIFNYDYNISLENDHHLNENLEILKNDLANEAVVPFLSYTTRAYLSGGDDATLIVDVVDPREGNDVFSFHKTDKKTPIRFSNGGVILSQKFAINNNLKEGDHITIESADGLKAEVEIADICEFYFQHYIFMSDSYYKSVFNENVHPTTIAVRTSDANALNKDTEKLQDFVSSLDFSHLISQFETMIEALDFIILVIIITAGSLAFVVLINLIEVNISERTREIATLKVLGFRNSEVNSYLFKEIIMLTIIGGLLGLPLGVVEHHFIMNVINMEMMMFGMTISLFSFSMSFAITLIFTVIVLFFTRRHLKNIKMVESLKSVE